MESLAAEKTKGVAGFRHGVDHKGAVVFTLPDGGVIRAQSRELFFSARDAMARQIALAYARKKWGKDIRLEGNRVFRDYGREQGQEKEKEHRRGMER